MQPALRSGSLALVAAVALAVAVFYLVGDGRAGTVGDCVSGADWGTLYPELAQEALDLVNEHRASLDPPRPPLKISAALMAAAEWKSLHMARYSYFMHNDPAPPVERTRVERFVACGYPYFSGENIGGGSAATSAEVMVQAWLDSPGHRAAIEHDGFVVTGIAMARRNGGIPYWTQTFGGYDDSGVTPAPTNTQGPASTPSPAPTHTATPSPTATWTPTATATLTPSPTASASPSPTASPTPPSATATQTPPTPTATSVGKGIALFEGWNGVSWPGPTAAGAQSIASVLDARMLPPNWEAIAAFDYLYGGWLQTFRNPPLPAFNTLGLLEAGKEYQLFVTGPATLALP